MQKSKVQSAVNWSAFDIGSRQVIGLIVLIILARILTPEDFGLIAILGVFMAVSLVFSDAGFSQSLIQRQDSSHEDESTIFFFNIFVSICVAFILWVFSDVLASYLGYPILKNLIIILAINVVICALGSVHTALLTKKLMFDVLAKAGIISVIISGIVAVYVATLGFGVWSLVIQLLLGSTINVLLLWYFHNWRPCFVFRFKTIKSYFSYGGYLAFDALLYVVQQHIYALVIGKYYSAAGAGMYSRAYGLVQMPIILLSSVVSRVAFPLFSTIQNDKIKMCEGLKKALTYTMFVALPISGLIFLLADSIVLILLGEQWLDVIPVLQVLSISATLMPMQMLNVNVLKALGHADIVAKLMLIKFAIAMGLLYLALPYGVVAIAWAFVLGHVFNLFINTYYTFVFLEYGIIRQIQSLSLYLLASALMMVVIVAVQQWFELLGLIKLFVSLLVGGIVYLGLAKIFRLEAFNYMVSLIKIRAAKKGGV